MMNSRFSWFAFLALLALGGRALAGDELTKQDLSDELPSIVSLASETELFTGFIASGQSRTNFTREHAAYLVESIQDEMKKLQKKPSPAIRNGYDECRADLLLLQSALKRISDGPTESEIHQLHSQAHEIHQRLSSVAASL
jgi:hypothetical protein